MIKIFMYHNIDADCSDRFVVTPAQFKRQLRMIKMLGYQSMTLSEAYQVLAGRERYVPGVVITFDDGYLDNYKFALPLLTEYDMKATLFAIAGWVGQDNEWDWEKRKRKFRHMDWNELREWQRQGMEIGSHSMNHARLSKVEAEHTLCEEIWKSKQLLEDKLQTPVEAFSYPWGDIDARAKQIVQMAGYQAAVSTKPGCARAGLDMYELPRYGVEAHSAFIRFGYRLVAGLG